MNLPRDEQAGTTESSTTRWCPTCQGLLDQIRDGALCVKCWRFYPADGSQSRPLSTISFDAFVNDLVRRWFQGLPEEAVSYQGIPLTPPSYYDLIPILISGARQILKEVVPR